MNTRSTAVMSSNGSPDQIDKIGVLAGLDRAVAIGDAQNARGSEGDARSAASNGMPCATALPANCFRLRELCVSKLANATVTPAAWSRAAFSSVMPSASNDGRLRQRIRDDGHVRACDLLRDHPAFGGTLEDELDVDLARKPQRAQDVACAIDADDQRQSHRARPGRVPRGRDGWPRTRGGCLRRKLRGWSSSRARPAALRGGSAGWQHVHRRFVRRRARPGSRRSRPGCGERSGSSPHPEVDDQALRPR